jgi:multiple sugar transport system substrate-binding protein
MAMKYDGPWALNSLDQVDGLDYGVAQPVAGMTGDKGAYMGGFGLVIPKGAKNADGAWAFMKWWTTQPKNSVDFGKISGWIPANIEAANDPFFTESPHYAAFIDTLEYAKVRPNVEGFADVEGKALVPALEQFLSGELTAEQTLAQAQQQGDAILSDAR